MSWSSSDETVVIVNEHGLVTAVNNGMSEVQARSSDFSASVQVVVSQVAHRIEIDPGLRVVIQPEERTQLTTTVLDRNEHRIGDAAVAWSSSDETVASVSEQGLVTGISEGTTQITARSGDAAAMVTVIVLMQSANSDRDALIVFYHVTGGPNWTNSTNWLSEEPLHSWHGVETSPEGEVTWLRLPENNVTGSIPAALGRLQHLRSLLLPSNGLIGPLPRELGDLVHLERLDLFGNQLSGELPREIGQLVDLIILSLASNELSGSLPPELGNMEHLEWLDLSANRFTGELPREIGQLVDLKLMNLASNGLTGSLPPELGDLEHLEWLDLAANRFTGELPREIGQLANLRGLTVASNELTGPLPQALGDLEHLEELDLNSNRFTGELPREIGQLANLREFTVASNELSGPLPQALDNLVNLKGLDLYSNQLSGSIPSELGGLVNLERLTLSRNRLTGSIPSSLGKLVSLEHLVLARNQLTGAVPPSFGDLINLKTLSLGENVEMAGILPQSITGLMLDELYLSNTRLCVPDNPEFESWLNQIQSLDGVEFCSGFLTKTSVILVQATQSSDFSVPLVAGEDALLRVFIKAETDMDVPMPPVTARFFVQGSQVFSVEIQTEGMAIPSNLDLGTLETSANTLIPGSVIQPSLEVVVEIDPENSLGDIVDLVDRFPMSGRMPVVVRRVPPLDLTLVPFLWMENPDLYASVPGRIEGLTADSDLFRLTRDILPVDRFSLSIHDPVWTANQPEGFSALEDTNLIYTMEGKRGHYMGIVSFGGVAHTPGFVSVSSLSPDLVAHELGHNMNLLHAPCGTGIDIDPDFPYENGEIGVWGYDLFNEVPVYSSTPDVMTYCGPPYWISDYNFSKSVVYRATEESGSGMASAFSSPAKGLLVWGGIDETGELFLRPAFSVYALSSLPDARGPYRVEGVDVDGNTLFEFNFPIGVIEHSEGGVFAFIVPMRRDWSNRLELLAVSGPEGHAELHSGSDRSAALLLDESTGTVRGILHEWLEPGETVQAARRNLPGPGLTVIESSGIPDVTDWNR